ATTVLYSFSLHDALPIYRRVLVVLRLPARDERVPLVQPLRPIDVAALGRLGQLRLSAPRRSADLGRCQEHGLLDGPDRRAGAGRSEEHTSELQSRSDLVC